MSLSFLSTENNTVTFNLTTTHIIRLTTSIDDETIWKDIKSFFNFQNSLIILAIILIIFFVFTICLVFIIIKLMKKKRSYKNQIKIPANNYSDIYFPFQTKNSLSPIQMGLTSNQIATQRDKDSSLINNNFENGTKRISNEKGRTSSSNTTNPLSMNNDEIETVNEVLAMEERDGKMYYKVNFTGHSPDYIAWICEDDLIPE